MKAKIQEAVKAAMKSKDRITLDTLRGALAAMQYEAMEKKVEELNTEQATAILQREVKKRKEEIEFAEKANREDLLERLNAEIKAIEQFLPKQLSAPELEKVIAGYKENGQADNLGAAMKLLKESYSGQYDSKLASELAKSMFS